jgi:DNA-directed RNA polymerase subunit E"
MKACRKCHLIIEQGSECPGCKSTDLTDKYSGLIIIFDPEKSEISKRIEAKVPGKYAVRVK